MSAVQGQLLVTGAPASRVLDVGLLLNEHPHVVLGIQRYAELGGAVDRFLLTPERLVAPLSVETRIRGELLYSRLRERIEGGAVRIAGDVDPGYVDSLRSLGSLLGEVRAVVVVGEPSAYERPQWRRSLQLARETELYSFARRVFVLDADSLLDGNRLWLEALLAFLELPLTDRTQAEYERLTQAIPRTPPGQDDDAGLRAWLEARQRSELERYGEARAVRLNDVVLDGDEVAARGREREQLLDQQRDGSDWGDDREALALGYVEQARETISRAAVIRRLRLTAAPGLPAPRLRVNLLAPSDARTAIGRTESIVQVARHLGRLCKVRLLCDEAPEPWLGEVEVLVSQTPEDALWDDCDVAIYPPGGAGAHPPAGGPRAIMWLDGFEPPDADHIADGLADADQVLAASSSLCRLAHRHGATAIHVPPGLDRRLFYPGPANSERLQHVTAVAQNAENMHWPELSEALVRVREARPDAAVTLLGGVPADGATEFLPNPPPRLIGETLRRSAIHVTTAREGFGFVGAAALACGAALVTTDGDGSLDYALDGRTAVVIDDGDPDAVAEQVVLLLDDTVRRARLAADGARQVHSLMAPWPEVARAMARVLIES